ncbi:predicted protein [Botrytis cinerea T4]|uniref:Uncharacterized protein n=1 Tax=Botryotinia fuckeliana (strain T4) TaxID=999810 RepID=G2YN08_BOTF4|nr:predicted protein [Botrytis cinerea T4]
MASDARSRPGVPRDLPLRPIEHDVTLLYMLRSTSPSCPCGFD